MSLESSLVCSSVHWWKNSKINTNIATQSVFFGLMKQMFDFVLRQINDCFLLFSHLEMFALK